MVQEARELARRVEKEVPEFRTGARLLASFVASLEEQGLLPTRLRETSLQKPATESTEKPRDLAQETFDLLGSLRESTDQERQILKEKGFIFLTVDAKSLARVRAENEEYFWYTNPSETLQEYTPPQSFEVAINPGELRLIRSNNSSQSKQLRMIGEYSQREIATVVPGAKAIMLPATGYAQLDIKYQKENDGAKLLPDFWARALDITVVPDVADVGRRHPDVRLLVDGWDRGYGPSDVWAVPAVVFVRE